MLSFAYRCLSLPPPQLEERRAENEALCEAHRERIQRLWDRLQVPQEEREAFSPHMVMSKKRNLDVVSDQGTSVRLRPPVCVCVFKPGPAHVVSCRLPPSQLQAEAQRLEELKLLNMRNVTEAIRSEIAVFWAKCFLSVDQRQQFVPYYRGEGIHICICFYFTAS